MVWPSGWFGGITANPDFTRLEFQVVVPDQALFIPNDNVVESDMLVRRLWKGNAADRPRVSSAVKPPGYNLAHKMLLPLLLIGLLTFLQQDAPEFDVVSVRPADPNIRAIGVLQAQDPVNLAPGGEFALRNRSIAELIQFAYAVHPTEVAGLPDWALRKRYDVVAKAPQGAAPGSSRLMMKTLLASEFKLTAHIENRPIKAFALTVAKKGPMLNESSGTELVGCHWGVAKLEQDGQTRLECLRMNMADFAYLLPRFAPGYVDKPVRDMTGLTGSYDFVLESTKKALVDAGSGGLTMYDALEKQVGLKLQEKKIPMPVVVVEHVDQPSAN